MKSYQIIIHPAMKYYINTKYFVDVSKQLYMNYKEKICLQSCYDPANYKPFPLKRCNVCPPNFLNSFATCFIKEHY